jgi:hypothetical protein
VADGLFGGEVGAGSECAGGLAGEFDGHDQPVSVSGPQVASERAEFTQPALVNGAVGLVMAPRGRLFLVLGFTIADDKITEIDVIADPDRLRQLDLAVVDD